MPLLMCPNCQTGMKEITRESVQIDICPACNGVWLDRGELNKLLDINRADAEAYAPQPRPMPMYAPQPHNIPGSSHYDPRYDKKYKKKSKLESVFDLFD